MVSLVSPCCWISSHEPLALGHECLCTKDTIDVMEVCYPHICSISPLLITSTSILQSPFISCLSLQQSPTDRLLYFAMHSTVNSSHKTNGLDLQQCRELQVVPFLQHKKVQQNVQLSPCCVILRDGCNL